MHFKLIQEVINRSVSYNWEEAKKEWDFYDISILKDSNCLCGKYPISERCHLINKNTSEKVIVGNCCINKFFGDKTKNKVFKAIKNNKINKSLIEHSFKISLINQWEYDFLSNLWRKRNLSPKQRNIFNKLKGRILEKFLHG